MRNAECRQEQGSQKKMKIPLNPPFSKGEIRFPPLEKGGKGGFERVYSIERYYKRQGLRPW